MIFVKCHILLTYIDNVVENFTVHGTRLTFKAGYYLTDDRSQVNS